jgi:GT2 family glycosyltransferase
MSDDSHRDAPELVIAILNWNGYELTRACLESVARLSGPAHTVLVVDNASREPEAQRLAREFPDMVEALPLARNMGVGGGYNAAIRWARRHGARFVLLLNNDTILDDPLMAQRLVDSCGPRVFAVGPLIKDPSGKVWSSGGTFDWETYLSGHEQAAGIVSHTTPYPVSWLDGSCMLVSVDAAYEVQGFDEVFFLYWEETDVCFRARRLGFECLLEPRASITHLVGGTARPSQVDYYMLRNSMLFMRRNGTRRQNLGFMRRMFWWRMPLFLARRVKHGGGIRQSVAMTAGSVLWNVRDAIRKHGWTYRPGGSLSPGDEK